MEAKRHFIYVAKGSRDLFPREGEPFDIIVDERKIIVKLNPKGRIWASPLFEGPMEAGKTIVLYKNPDGTFKFMSG